MRSTPPLVALLILCSCGPHRKNTPQTHKGLSAVPARKTCKKTGFERFMRSELTTTPTLTARGSLKGLWDLRDHKTIGAIIREEMELPRCLNALQRSGGAFVFQAAPKRAIIHFTRGASGEGPCYEKLAAYVQSLGYSAAVYSTSQGYLLKIGKGSSQHNTKGGACLSPPPKAPAAPLSLTAAMFGAHLKVEVLPRASSRLAISVKGADSRETNGLNVTLQTLLDRLGGTSLVRRHLGGLMIIPAGERLNLFWDMEPPTLKLVTRLTLAFSRALAATQLRTTVPMRRVVQAPVNKPKSATFQFRLWGDPRAMKGVELARVLKGLPAQVTACAREVGELPFVSIDMDDTFSTLRLGGRGAVAAMHTCMKSMNLGFRQFDLPGQMGHLSTRGAGEALLVIRKTDAAAVAPTLSAPRPPFKEGQLRFALVSGGESMAFNVKGKNDIELQVLRKGPSIFGPLALMLRSLKVIPSSPAVLPLQGTITDFGSVRRFQARSRSAKVPFADLTGEIVLRNLMEVLAHARSQLHAHNLVAAQCRAHTFSACDQIEDHYIATKNPKMVVAVNRYSCKVGNLISCNRLALLYEFGKGVPKDLKRAMGLYKRACHAKGTYHACNNLANIYERQKKFKQGLVYIRKGCVVQGDKTCAALGSYYISMGAYKKGVPILRAACLAKKSAHCVTLGNVYMKYFRNYTKSRLYNEMACDLENSTGCNNLGYLYAEKLGNNSKAAKYYRKACEMDNYSGCLNMGYYFEFTKKDLKRAARYYKIGCDKDHAESCGLLGNLYVSQKKYTSAQKLFASGCARGWKSQCLELADLFMFTLKQPHKGGGLAKKLCDGGYISACGLYARYLIDHKKLYDKGLKLYLRQCTASIGQGCHSAGNLFFYHYNDLVNAAKMQSKACDLGVDLGCSRAAQYYYRLGNAKKYVPLLKRSCRAGYNYTCVVYGDYFLNQKKLKRALQLFLKGCKSYGIGCFKAGKLLLNKLQKPKVGVRLLVQGCDMKWGEACQVLGELYATGTTLPLSVKKGQFYFAKACTLGVKKACILVKGKGK